MTTPETRAKPGSVSVNKLRPGACLIREGVPLELLYLAHKSEGEQAWWCKRIFVDVCAIDLFVFRSGALYRAIHGKLVFSY